MPSCSVDGCDKAPRSSKADLCKMHYHRWYRHGSVDVTAVGMQVKTAGRTRSRYRQIYAPQHPLASKGGKVYEHRTVLFDAIGSGVHPCHWCSTPLTWGVGHAAVDQIEVDHLDNDGFNNELDNLVPSCRVCNGRRASQIRAEMLRSLGLWVHHDTIAGLRGYKRKPAVVAAR